MSLNLVGLIALALSFAGLSSQIDHLLHLEQKKNIARVIQKTHPPHQNLYQSIHKAFQDTFDRIYKRSSDSTERLAWIGIIVSYLTVFCARTSTWLFNIYVPTPVFLTLALVIAIAAVFGIFSMFISKYMIALSTAIDDKLRLMEDPKYEFIFRFIILFVLALVGTGFIAYISTLSGISLIVLPSVVVIGGIVAPLGAQLALSVILYPISIDQSLIDHEIIIEPRKGKIPIIISCLSMVVTAGLFTGTIYYAVNSGQKETARIFAASLALAMVSLSVPLVTLIVRRLISINPLRSMLSSIIVIFVLILSSIVTGISEIGEIYIREIRSYRNIALLYLLFNIFADSISIFETKKVLNYSKNMNIIPLFLLLLFDLLLSGLIYILLPIFVGQDLDILLRAVFLRGAEPWIGILFWSTFSTSIIFYLFVISILILRFFKIPAHIVKYTSSRLRIEERPMLYISVTCSTLIVLLLLIYSFV